MKGFSSFDSIVYEFRSNLTETTMAIIESNPRHESQPTSVANVRCIFYGIFPARKGNGPHQNKSRKENRKEIERQKTNAWTAAAAAAARDDCIIVSA